MTKTYSIPENFYWGGTSAANQCEGGHNENGKGSNAIDILTNGSATELRKVAWEANDSKTGVTSVTWGKKLKLSDGTKPALLDNYYYSSYEGTDFYHHHQKDTKYMAEMGFNMSCLSLSWSRILSNGDDQESNKESLVFYDKAFDECTKYGIEPLVILSHYEIPLPLINRFGGWKGRKTIDTSVHYADIAMNHYKGKVRYWLTFSEISAVDMVPYMGEGLIDGSKQNRTRGVHNQFVVSNKVVKLAYETDKNNQVDQMPAYSAYYPYTLDPVNQLLVMKTKQEMFFYPNIQVGGHYPEYRLKEHKRDGIKLDGHPEDYKLIEKYPVDFLSFSCYTSDILTTHETDAKANGNMSAGGVKNPYPDYDAWGWVTDPDVSRITSNNLWDRYHKPLFIVENGLDRGGELTKDHKVHGDYCINYLRAQVKSMEEVVSEDEISLTGYTVWPATDLVSNGTDGMEKRYGLVYVDHNDKGNDSLKRYPKDLFS